MTTTLFFILGACFGSFFGLLIDRYPNQSIIKPRSHCNYCKQTLKAIDLIPILSQALFLSKCRYCHHKIPVRYLFLEVLCGLLFSLLHFDTLSFPIFLTILCGLVLSGFDIKDQSFPLIIWVIFMALLAPLSSITFLTSGLIILSVLAQFFDLKIGSGDFIFLAGFTLTVDSLSIFEIIEAASLLGIGYFILFPQKRTKSIPFVPFIFLAYLFILLKNGYLNR